MKLLEEKIRQEGRVLPGNILKVDHFINHMIDPEIVTAMGEDFYQHFKDQGINKILTLEVSGIPMAFAAAQFLKVPVLFAKKISSLTLGEDVYASRVTSYTKKKTYDIMVDRHYLTVEDRVLIIDDFLARGEALNGLLDLCQQAGAEVVGVGIGIEKAFQEGGKKHRQAGIEIYSQARIAGFEEDQVIFVEES